MISSPRLWDCPKCNHTHATPNDQPGTPMHICPGFHGMEIPMRELGADHDVRLVERQDYVGDEQVRVDDEGTPWMAAQVIHGDGSWDQYAYAPVAVLDLRGE